MSTLSLETITRIAMAMNMDKFNPDVMKVLIREIDEDIDILKHIKHSVEKVIGESVKHFNKDYITKIDGSWNNKPFYWMFDCSMISACGAVFRDCQDNHEVTDRLKKEKLIHSRTMTDSESSSTVIIFTTEKAGHNFIDRLNKYIRDWHEKH